MCVDAHWNECKFEFYVQTFIYLLLVVSFSLMADQCVTRQERESIDKWWYRAHLALDAVVVIISGYFEYRETRQSRREFNYKATTSSQKWDMEHHLWDWIQRITFAASLLAGSCDFMLTLFEENEKD